MLRMIFGGLRASFGSDVSLVLSWSFLAGNFLAVVVLLGNAFALGVVWPYLAAIIWILAQAALIFARLIILPVSRGPTT